MVCCDALIAHGLVGLFVHSPWRLDPEFTLCSNKKCECRHEGPWIVLCSRCSAEASEAWAEHGEVVIRAAQTDRGGVLPLRSPFALLDLESMD